MRDAISDYMRWCVQNKAYFYHLQMKEVAYLITSTDSDTWEVQVIKNRYGGSWIADWCKATIGDHGWEIIGHEKDGHLPILRFTSNEAWVLWTMRFG